MNALIIGVYGLYLILTGLAGNAGALAGKVQDDAPKFLPWVIAIFVLAFLHGSSEAGRKITGPFIFLLVLTFILKRFDTLKSQSQQLWDMAANAKPSTTSGGDKVAPAGSMSTSTQQQPLTPASPAVNDAIHSLVGPSSTTPSNMNGASDALFALENLLG